MYVFINVGMYTQVQWQQLSEKKRSKVLRWRENVARIEALNAATSRKLERDEVLLICAVLCVGVGVGVWVGVGVPVPVPVPVPVRVRVRVRVHVCKYVYCVCIRVCTHV